MDDNARKLENFLNPALLKHNLIFVSLFISVYENFKSSIVEDVKYFYWSGFDNNKEEFKKYDKEVLNKVKSKKNQQIRATLLWFKEHGAILDNDIQDFDSITNMRNTLAHNMTNFLFEGLPENIYDLFTKMIKLFEHITKWWIVEIEIPTNPDFTPEQYESINWDEITSVNLEFIKMATDIALTDNQKYYDVFMETVKKESSSTTT